MDKETEAYLAKIRKTVAESRRMIESVKLRFEETDRMLEESGTSREEVLRMRFSPEQKAVVNMELERLGFMRMDDEGKILNSPSSDFPLDAADASPDIENRRRKFGAMMKIFRM